MVDTWFQSLMVMPPRICGRRLKPFSLIHFYTLKVLENPYIAGGEYTKESLLEAINICSKDWIEIKHFISCFDWKKKVSFFFWARHWVKKDLKTASESFQTYIGDYLSVPQHIDKGDKHKMSAPWEFHLVRILMGQYGFSEYESWNMPIGRARCYYDAWAESQGDDTLKSPEQEEADKLIVQANDLAKQGKQKEADELYIQASQVLNKAEK